MPDPGPLLTARHVVLVGSVPRVFGGRTASILTKCRLLAELAGVPSTILTLNHTTTSAEQAADLRRRGLLVDGVDLVNVYDVLRDGAGPRAAGGEGQREAAASDCGEGCGPAADTELRRDERAPDGTLRRTTYLDPEHHLPRHEVYLRADGTPYLNAWLRPDPDRGASEVERLALLDREGRPTQVLQDEAELVQHALRRLVGNAHVLLVVESRDADRAVETLRDPHVKQLAVLHNSHLLGSGDDPDLMRPGFRRLFDRGDELAAVVFLTETQRAEVAAQLGERANFRVVPHPVRAQPPVPFDERDPDLVVMLARLEPQKQLAHAVEAFAQVVRAVPTARLEIHGEGQERAELQRLVDEAGLSGSVTLAGYTKDPSRVYRRAALSLLTSSFEGYPLVLLETLAHGCPVVSYDVRYGPAEIVADGVDGFLVAPGDVDALARRVVEVLTDRELRRRLSEAAGVDRPEFSEQTFVERWLRLFRELDAAGWN